MSDSGIDELDARTAIQDVLEMTLFKFAWQNTVYLLPRERALTIHKKSIDSVKTPDIDWIKCSVTAMPVSRRRYGSRFTLLRNSNFTADHLNPYGRQRKRLYNQDLMQDESQLTLDCLTLSFPTEDKLKHDNLNNISTTNICEQVRSARFHLRCVVLQTFVF